MKVDLFSIGRFTIHTYGVMIAIGVILCVLMGYYRAKRYRRRRRNISRKYGSAPDRLPA